MFVCFKSMHFVQDGIKILFCSVIFMSYINICNINVPEALYLYGYSIAVPK